MWSSATRTPLLPQRCTMANKSALQQQITERGVVQFSTGPRMIIRWDLNLSQNHIDVLELAIWTLSMSDEPTVNSDLAYGILERAAADLASAGLHGVAAFRFMSWGSADRMAASLPPGEALDNLKRLRNVVDTRIAEVEASADAR
jgi:hypothetical protein